MDRPWLHRALSRLEPYVAKVSSTVLRGGGGRKAILLPDYLREEYALDALVECAAVADDPSREVPNPAWAAVDAQLRGVLAHLDRLQAEYGLEALSNLEHRHRTMRGFKTAHGKLGQKIWNAWQRVLQLEKRRAAVPRRVPIQTIMEDPVARASRPCEPGQPPHGRDARPTRGRACPMPLTLLKSP